MRKFVGTIAIGFVLIAALFIRLIGIQREEPARRSKKKSSQSSTQSNLRAKNADPTSLAFKQGRIKVKALDDFEVQKTDPEQVLKNYYESGVLSSEWPFKRGRLEGSVRLYYANGARWKEMTFKANQLEGEMRSYYPSGALLSSTHYANGAPDGPARQFYPGGALWIETVYASGKTLETRPFSENGNSPQEKTESERTAFQEGIQEFYSAPVRNQQNKVKYTYYQSGVPSAEWNYEHGVLEGMSKVLGVGGEVFEEMNFKEGAPDGVWLSYDGNGVLREEVNYSSGDRDGFSKVYYQSGKLWVQTQYARGRMAGFPKAYSEGGKIFQEVRVIQEKRVES